ncbi:MarR family winged helix-turn-helix transcriptional regulator [Frankia sp. AgKG'84/4]|uniref:MarR family winged helix-turn-helix transcriptional regulator n=1 Tax=Frankia sp. AgKG'84/4 TaxID=573490 RepID=UPI00200F1E47|nr:MarR family transcriptional regulator [Frankia sp. AgKG'84/4]MCL9794058.1 MarR family transcriptional regulator [Frankia sp. AgKG'84/4]
MTADQLLDAPAADAAERVWRRMRTMVLDRHSRRREVCETLDLSFIRVKALLRLARGPSTMHELAVSLSTDRPYTTVVIDELERRELVLRTVDPDDRRRRVVELTDAGRDTAHRAERLLNDPPEVLLHLSPADLATLDRITDALAGDADG